MMFDCGHTIRSARSASICIVALLLIGCSTEEPLPPSHADDASAADSRRVGSLLAEFEHTDGDRSPRVNVHAHFLDARGIPVETAFDALEVWSSNRELDRDACTMEVADQPSRQTAAPSKMRLDLLSVGPITVDGPNRRMRMEARRLPDLLNSFSGVIYGTDQSSPEPTSSEVTYEPGAAYTFRAPGDRSAGRFDVRLRAPQPVRIEAVSGRSGESADEVRLEAGRKLRVRWNTPEETHGSVFFDVASGFGPESTRLKCRLEDDGSFTLPDEILEQLSEDSDTLHVAIRRVQSKRVGIAGLEHSEFSLSTVDRLTLHVD